MAHRCPPGRTGRAGPGLPGPDDAQAVGGDAGAGVHAQAAGDAVRLITEVAQALPRNPQESLLLQSLLVRLGALSV